MEYRHTKATFMLDNIEIKKALQEHLQELETLELHELLHRHQLLLPLLRKFAEEQLAKEAHFSPEDEAILIRQAWQDLEDSSWSDKAYPSPWVAQAQQTLQQLAA